MRTSVALSLSKTTLTKGALLSLSPIHLQELLLPIIKQGPKVSSMNFQKRTNLYMPSTSRYFTKLNTTT
jgi:hypothetical protein